MMFLCGALLLISSLAQAADRVVVIPLNRGGSATGDAVASEVLAGKTFSNADETGISGSMPNRGAVSITPSTVNQTIPEGYHNGSGGVVGDAELLPGNIADGVEIFSVTGTANVATGNALAADVLVNKTFSTGSGSGLSGSMTDNGSFSLSCGSTDQTVSPGYSSGGTLSGDAELIPGNIAAGVEIFSVTGTANVATGNALAADVLVDKTFSTASGSGLSGSMPNQGAVSITPSTADQTIPAGYHNGSGGVPGDTDLVSGNIAAGVDIFGVLGNFTGGAAYIGAAVPQTGQIIAYDGNTPQKDDGALQRGLVWTAATRFTDNLDRTITDNITGLIWLQDTNCMGANYPDEDMDSNDPTVDCSTVPVTDPNMTGECTDGKVFWQHSLDFAVGVNAGSFPLCNSTPAQSDWRVPNIKELLSLIDYGENDPALPDGHPFLNVNNRISWSSSTDHASGVGGTEAWGVHWQNGRTWIQIKATNDHAFMLVRGGQ